MEESIIMMLRTGCPARGSFFIPCSGKSAAMPFVQDLLRLRRPKDRFERFLKNGGRKELQYASQFPVGLQRKGIRHAGDIIKHVY